jgi:hypothetical protein
MKHETKEFLFEIVKILFYIECGCLIGAWVYFIIKLVK